MEEEEAVTVEEGAEVFVEEEEVVSVATVINLEVSCGYNIVLHKYHILLSTSRYYLREYYSKYHQKHSAASVPRDARINFPLL